MEFSVSTVGNLSRWEIEEDSSMALQATFPASAVPHEDCFHWLDGDVGPRIEARGLVALVRTDAESVESVRELIDIPPRVERVLRYYMRTHPEDAAGLEKALRFRKSVREEFDRLVSESKSPASSADFGGARLVGSGRIMPCGAAVAVTPLQAPLGRQHPGRDPAPAAPL
jgi:hypothetical protein